MIQRITFNRIMIDVAVIGVLAFIGLMLLTAYRVSHICANAPQACQRVVIVPQPQQPPQQGPPK